jgi:hypothetical protein
MRYLVILMMIGCLFIGCEKNIKDKRLTAKNLEEVKSSDRLTEREKELIVAYVLRMGMKSIMQGESTKSVLDSTLTFADVIEKQRKWLIEDSIRVAEEKRLAEEALAKREAELAKLREIVLVSLLKKEYKEYDYESYVTITLAIVNNSDKTIKGIKGILRLQDMFDDPIINLQIKHDTKIPAGKREITTSSYEYNQFMDEHKRFRFTSLDKIKVKWEPEVIIFDDDTRIQLSD